VAREHVTAVVHDTRNESLRHPTYRFDMLTGGVQEPSNLLEPVMGGSKLHFQSEEHELFRPA
jgi:hypothetical protein